MDLAVSREHRSDDVEGLEGVVIVSGGDEDMSSVIAMHLVLGTPYTDGDK